MKIKINVREYEMKLLKDEMPYKNVKVMFICDGEASTGYYYWDAGYSKPHCLLTESGWVTARFARNANISWVYLDEIDY